MSAVSGTSAHEFEQVQEIQPPSVQKCFLHDLCRSAQSRSGDHKTHVKIGCALHNGCRQMLLYVPFSFCAGDPASKCSEMHDLCRSAQSRSGDHKTHVKIGCALHNGCRQMLLYVPFSFCYSVFWVICWSLDVYMSDLSYLVQGESSLQCWTSLLCS